MRERVALAAAAGVAGACVYYTGSRLLDYYRGTVNRWQAVADESVEEEKRRAEEQCAPPL